MEVTLNDPSYFGPGLVGGIIVFIWGVLENFKKKAFGYEYWVSALMGVTAFLFWPLFALILFFGFIWFLFTRVRKLTDKIFGAKSKRNSVSHQNKRHQ
ncbi:MAG: hypothetical protein CBB65_00180 [Hyphomonadaceae bacterium TMED5]|nr:hypothetical protein [Ponticaulis sp.]OUY01572.1 MAG: hypothetical protein CBB65_00180 [Hyphomonadaceae bacterium TMED5]